MQAEDVSDFDMVVMANGCVVVTYTPQKLSWLEVISEPISRAQAMAEALRRTLGINSNRMER